MKQIRFGMRWLKAGKVLRPLTPGRTSAARLRSWKATALPSAPLTVRKTLLRRLSRSPCGLQNAPPSHQGLTTFDWPTYAPAHLPPSALHALFKFPVAKFPAANMC
jgi:hypothetical protein